MVKQRTDEEELRIKYGDLLKNAEKEKLMEEQHHAKFSWRDFPPETPRSFSVWERGFYYKEGVLKYRTSVGQALIPYTWRTGCFQGCVTLFLVLLFLATLTTRVAWIGMFVLFIIWLGVRLKNLHKYSLNPDTEINLNKRTVKGGRFFVTEIPFEDIGYMHIYEQRGVISNNWVEGTIIVLGAARKKETDRRREIHFATFHPWEEYDVGSVKDTILFILGKELKVEYFYL